MSISGDGTERPRLPEMPMPPELPEMPVEGIRDIDGSRINAVADELASLARDIRHRGIIIELPIIGKVPITLGPEQKPTSSSES